MTGVDLQYLGQEGFSFRDARGELLIDPYLSWSVDRLPGFSPGFWKRNYPPPVSPAELRDADLVLCTHDHLDHADPETLLGLAGASPHCRFGGPRATVALFHRIGIAPERTFVLNAGRSLRWRGVTIEPVAAAHEHYEVDAEGFHRFLGFLLRWNGAVFYHAGDTVVTDELSARLATERIDMAFLPVNGGDAARRRLDIAGNMDVRAAAALAARHRFGWVVPMHHDLYPNNGVSCERLLEEWQRQPEIAGVRLKLFRPGENLRFT